MQQETLHALEIHERGSLLESSLRIQGRGPLTRNARRLMKSRDRKFIDAFHSVRLRNTLGSLRKSHQSRQTLERILSFVFLLYCEPVMSE